MRDEEERADQSAVECEFAYTVMAKTFHQV